MACFYVMTASDCYCSAYTVVDGRQRLSPSDAHTLFFVRQIHSEFCGLFTEWHQAHFSSTVAHTFSCSRGTRINRTVFSYIRLIQRKCSLICTLSLRVEFRYFYKTTIFTLATKLPSSPSKYIIRSIHNTYTIPFVCRNMFLNTHVLAYSLAPSEYNYGGDNMPPLLCNKPASTYFHKV